MSVIFNAVDMARVSLLGKCTMSDHLSYKEDTIYSLPVAKMASAEVRLLTFHTFVFNKLPILAV